MPPKQIALVCKLMPLYRLGVFHELSKTRKYEFTCFGDTKKQGGIQVIPWSLANPMNKAGIKWIKTSNYFYIPERLLWQTGIVKRIFWSKYDCFIFEGGVFHLPTWLFAILCRLKGKKVLFWTHGFKGFDKGLKKIIRILYFKLADGLLLYGNFSKELMIKSGFRRDKLFVVYNSLDTTKQFKLLEDRKDCLVKQEKSKIFKNSELFTVIFIGRLVKAKKIQFLLKAVNQFSKKKSPINCIIIGDGPEMKSLKDFVKSNKLENETFFTGALYKEEDICKYFEMADLMVSPGNVGLNCMHSFAYGVPVLTHNNLQFHGPEVEAITPGETGILFEYNNYEDMTVKLEEWKYKNYTKEEVRIKCHDILSKRYNPVSHAKRIIEAIDQL
jgi:glycosyltransferase involved in cell wall biosynthesis